MSSHLDQSILPLLGKTGKMIYVFMTDKFREHDIELTLEQFIVLRVLHQEDGQPQHNLALITKRHKASLTRLIGTLERKNLVARIPDSSDKRVNRIFLTKHGRRLFTQTLPVIEEAIAQVQSTLSQTEIDSLITIIQKVQKNLIIE